MSLWPRKWVRCHQKRLLVIELNFFCCGSYRFRGNCAGGGIVLRCDVFVDTISRIEITTRTRELLLEEEPERFELQALDDEGEGAGRR